MIKSWIKLIVCGIVIWGFIKLGPCVFGKFNTYKKMVSNSELMGIDNAALFYSEEKHSLMAQEELSERLKEKTE